MRGNGLFAASYTAVAELDPPVADAMLEVLREAGVAAYAEPSPGRRGPYLDVQLGGAPRDRLFVDRECRNQAVGIVADRVPALRSQLTQLRNADATPAVGEDEAWAALVARFNEPVTDAVPTWPVLEDVDSKPATEPAESPSVGHGTPASSVEPAGAGEEPTEHFVPPPPPPLPRLDPVSRLAWAGLLGGPSVLVLAALTGWMLPHFVVAWAIVAFVTGFVTLVVRMKDRPPDEQADGGAVL